MKVDKAKAKAKANGRDTDDDGEEDLQPVHPLRRAAREMLGQEVETACWRSKDGIVTIKMAGGHGFELSWSDTTGENVRTFKDRGFRAEPAR